MNIHIWMPGDLGVPEWVLGWAYSDMDDFLSRRDQAVSSAVTRVRTAGVLWSRATPNLEPA